MPKPSLDIYERRRAELGAAYKMHLSYIGTGYSGFQSQIDHNAIQDHVEKALSTILRHPLRIRGASRTDRGVHALQQVTTFRTHVPYSRRWLLGINALLPEGIGAHSLEPVADDFDPIYDARAKAYRYRLWRGRCFDPFLKPFVWGVPYPVDFDLLRQVAEEFVGRHDFAGFCNKDSDAKTTIRRVIEVKIDERGPLVDFWICGEGFLKQMVRIIVGTLVEIGAGKLPRTQVQKILQTCRREDGGTTAPAQGLSLVELFYDEVPSLAEMVAKSEKGYCAPVFAGAASALPLCFTEQ